MRNIISITVSADHRVCCPEWDIARTGENDCTRFEITLAEELSTYSAYIDFEKPDGEKFKTPRLNIEYNRIIYDLPSAVLDVKGNLLVRLVLQNDEGEIWKSNVQKFYVSESVDATEAIVEKDDFVADIEKRVKELNVGLKNKVDKLDTNNVVYATDNSTPAKTIGIQYMESPFEGTIPIRDGIGSLQVPTAQDDTQAVNKGQMDTALDGKVDKTTASFKIYGTGLNGEPTLYNQVSGEAVKFTLPLRNAKGAIVAANPTQDNELTTKEYVDNLVQAPADNGVFTGSITIGNPDADTTGGTNTVIADTSIDMWSRAGGEELTITLDNDPNVYYRNRGQSKYGSAKFEDIVNVANAYAGASFYLTPFTVDNLKADTIEVQDALILKSPNGTKYKLTVSDDGTLSTAKVD